MNLNRTTQFLAGAVAALLALAGVAALTAPDDAPTGVTATAARLPVDQSTLACPAPTTSDLAETLYTSFTPKGGSGPATGRKGTADLLPAPRAVESGGDTGKGKGKPKRGKPVAPLKEPGTPARATASDSGAPALVGSADGALAPGWTVQQTTVIQAGPGRGALGASCTAPDTEFWFPGISLADGRRDYVHLTNPDDTVAVVDLQMYGRKGGLKTTTAEDIIVPPHSSLPVLLSTLTREPATDATLDVVAREGRIGASVQALDAQRGSDWLPAAADPASKAVLPGIPKDATSVQLVAMATGEDDADLDVKLAGPTGKITPAGLETLNLKSGMTTSVDMKDLTKGEPGSLVLTPAEGGHAAPFVAALRVTRGKGTQQETAFIPATGRIAQRATVADNRAWGTVLSLVASGRTAKVKVTVSAGGRPVSRTYEIKGGTTEAITPKAPPGAREGYAITVEPVSGGPVHAARTLTLPQNGIPMFTVQTLPDDGGMVAVPKAAQDLSVLTG